MRGSAILIATTTLTLGAIQAEARTIFVSNEKGNSISVVEGTGSDLAPMKLHFGLAGPPQQIDLEPSMTAKELEDVQPTLGEFKTLRDGRPVIAGIIEPTVDGFRICWDVDGKNGRPVEFAVTPATVLCNFRRPRTATDGSEAISDLALPRGQTSAPAAVRSPDEIHERLNQRAKQERNP